MTPGSCNCQRVRCALATLSTLIVAVAMLVALSVTRVQAADYASIADDHQARFLYERAAEAWRGRDYASALTHLRELKRRWPAWDNDGRVQTRIAVLHEAADARDALPLYLDALDQRDAGRPQAAIDALAGLLARYNDSTLIDDALYLTAYIQVMDQYEFGAAQATLYRLLERMPDSAYADSASYLLAIAYEQAGLTQAAIETMTQLRDRHTGLDLPFGVRMAAGTVVSRYWFDRADRRLAIMRQRQGEASRVSAVQSSSDRQWRARVRIGARQREVLLIPATLASDARWLDGRLADRAPAPIGLYTGRVLDDEHSWVRATLVDDSLSGMAYVDGQIVTLHPDNLLGTLEYYQPDAAARLRATSLDGIDSDLMPPLAAPGGALSSGAPQYRQGQRAATRGTDLRLVPVSIVVDSHYDNYHGGTGEIVALTSLNVADGLFRQFGIALSVDEVLVFDSTGADPLAVAPTTLETLLRNFRDYRLNSQALFRDSVLTYLFTGNPRTDIALGLAWIDTACRVDGYDVGVTTPSAIAGLLLTHEIGHSLGAQHDTDTACNADSRKLMWPQLSSRTSAEFSECSRERFIAARERSCLLDAVDLALNMEAVGGQLEFGMDNRDSTLAVDADLLIETGEARQLVWPAGCQPQTPTSANCPIGALAAGEHRVLALPLDPSVSDPASLVVAAQLTPRDIADPEPGNNVVTTDVDFLADTQLADAGGIDPLPVAGSSLDGQAEPSASAASGAVSRGLVLVLLCGGVLRTRRRRGARIAQPPSVDSDGRSPSTTSTLTVRPSR